MVVLPAVSLETTFLSFAYDILNHPDLCFVYARACVVLYYARMFYLFILMTTAVTGPRACGCFSAIIHTYIQIGPADLEISGGQNLPPPPRRLT